MNDLLKKYLATSTDEVTELYESVHALMSNDRWVKKIVVSLLKEHEHYTLDSYITDAVKMAIYGITERSVDFGLSEFDLPTSNYLSINVLESFITNYFYGDAGFSVVFDTNSNKFIFSTDYDEGFQSPEFFYRFCVLNANLFYMQNSVRRSILKPVTEYDHTLNDMLTPTDLLDDDDTDELDNSLYAGLATVSDIGEFLGPNYSFILGADGMYIRDAKTSQPIPLFVNSTITKVPDGNGDFTFNVSTPSNTVNLTKPISTNFWKVSNPPTESGDNETTGIALYSVDRVTGEITEILNEVTGAYFRLDTANTNIGELVWFFGDNFQVNRIRGVFSITTKNKTVIELAETFSEIRRYVNNLIVFIKK